MEETAFRIDMHVHTARHSECAELLTPEKIDRFARAAGLDGVLITEHDTLWHKRHFGELRQTTELLLYNGIEVSTADDSHLVILGIEEQGPLRRGIPCREAITYVHGQGGVVILAHPFRKSLPPLSVIEQVDAIEIASTSLYSREAYLSRHLAETLAKPAIASSDAHAPAMLGWAYTLFPRKPEGMNELCTMIRNGEGIPVVPHEFLEKERS